LGEGLAEIPINCEIEAVSATEDIEQLAEKPTEPIADLAGALEHDCVTATVESEDPPSKLRALASKYGDV